MSDFLEYGGIVLVVLILLFLILLGVANLATIEGDYTVYPQTGESFKIKSYMSGDSCIYYTKPDGTTGKVYGNFRVEQTTQCGSETQSNDTKTEKE